MNSIQDTVDDNLSFFAEQMDEILQRLDADEEMKELVASELEIQWRADSGPVSRLRRKVVIDGVNHYVCSVLGLQDTITLRTGIHDDEDRTTGNSPWLGGLVMAHWLSSPQCCNDFRARTVVELGAGLGLCGIALCVAHPATGNIVLTDVESLTPLLKQNVLLNQQLFAGCIPTAATLLWGETDSMPVSPGSADIIICSETLYSRKATRELLITIETISAEICTAFFAFQARKLEMEAEFFSQLSTLGFVIADETDGVETFGFETIRAYRARRLNRK